MRDVGEACRSNLTTYTTDNSRGKNYRCIVRMGTPPKGGSPSEHTTDNYSHEVFLLCTFLSSERKVPLERHGRPAETTGRTSPRARASSRRPAERLSKKSEAVAERRSSWDREHAAERPTRRHGGRKPEHEPRGGVPEKVQAHEQGRPARRLIKKYTASPSQTIGQKKGRALRRVPPLEQEPGTRTQTPSSPAVD